LTFKQLRALIATVLERPKRNVAAERAVPEGEELAEAAARLEAALERIAREAAERPPSERIEDPRVARVVARLDALIASLRGALARSG
jgi:broad specificity phosphatase PhoE